MTFCLREVREAAKDLLNDEDAKALIKDLRDRARAKAQSKGISYQQALVESQDELISDLERETAQAKYQTYLNIVKRIDREKFYEPFNNDAKAMRALLVGVQSNVKGSRMSTDLLQKTLSNKLLGSFYIDLKKNNLVEAFNSKAYETQLAQELFQEGSSGNEEAKKLAAVVKKWFHESVKMQNKEGASISELEEYMGRQSHNVDRLRETGDSLKERMNDRIDYQLERIKTGQRYDKTVFYEKAFQRWKTYIEPRLDGQRTFNGAEPGEFLRSVYDNLISGIHDTKAVEPDEKMYSFSGPGNLAKKISQSRVLHFKDGMSFFEYNQKFGYGSMHANILKTLENSGINTGLMKIWGTNPEAAFKNDLRKLQEKSENKRNPTQVKQLSENRLSKYFKEVSGFTKGGVSNLASKIFATLRSGVSLAKLGFSALRSIPDLANRAARMRSTSGIPFFEGMRTAASDVMRGRPKGEMEHIADLTGVWTEALAKHTVARLSSIDAPGGFTAKAMQLFFKLNGMHWWDEVNQKADATWIARNLSIIKESEFEKLHPNEQKTFNLYGIENKEWDLIRTGAENLANDKTFITPESMMSLKEEDIARYLGKKVSKLTPREIEDTRSDMQDRLQSYFIDQVAQTIPYSDGGARSVLLQGTQAGTVAGEFARLIAQFKMFPVLMTRNVLGRMVLGNSNDGVLNAFISGKADISGIAQFIAGSSALWYLGNSIADMAKGRNPRPVDSPATWGAALLGGGGMGIYGDFLFGEYTKNRFGSSAVETFMGPVVGEFAEALRVIAKVKSGDDPTNALFHMIKNDTPFINLFYTRIALDYLILYGIQERIQPGSLARMEQNLQKEQEQTYIFPPSQYAVRH